MSRFILILVSGILLQGCMTAYKGPNPDFQATGGEATEQIKKFTLKEHTFWEAGPFLKMGPDETPYTMDSMSPVVESVSSEAFTNLQRAELWRRNQLVALGIGLFSLAAVLVTEDPQTKRDLARLSIAGSLSSIGFGLYSGALTTKVPGPYNRDLKSKLTPVVGMNWTY